MLYGTIVTYFEDKSYGFIRSDTGKDIFFHLSVIESEQTPPQIRVGQSVKYELEPRQKVIPGEEDQAKKRNDQSRAKVVILLQRAPGGIAADDQPKARHPKARKRKPTWRR